MFDPSDVRRHFPALHLQQNGRPVLYFDNPAGTQVPRATIDGFTRYLEGQNANVGGAFRTSQETGLLIDEARQGMADFLNAASPHEIVFGQNMTSLTFGLSRAIGATLQPGDEIVLTRLEHDANVSPWLALQERGIVVRWIDINPADMTLDLSTVEAALSDRTRLLCVGLASNAFGTVNPVRDLARMAHACGALVFVDAVHYGPHGPIDVAALECDFLVCSAYKFFGPHLGILWGRLDLLQSLPAYKVRPAGDDSPHRWETGTQSHESLSGLLGTLTYLQTLGQGDSRRAGLRDAMTAIRAYERILSERLIGGLTQIRGARVFGIIDPAQFHSRVPTASFLLEARDPQEVATELGVRGIFSWAGNHYAVEPLGRLGLQATQRVGLAHYNLIEEVDHFLEEVDDIARHGTGSKATRLPQPVGNDVA